MKKYLTFIKYLIVSASSSIIDLGVFTLLKSLVGLPIMVATIIARVISSLFNYMMNKGKVFKSDESTVKTFILYYILVVVTMLLSGTFVTLLDKLLPINTTIIKVIVDVILFIMNYNIQKYLIFKNTSSKKE